MEDDWCVCKLQSLSGQCQLAKMFLTPIMTFDSICINLAEADQNTLPRLIMCQVNTTFYT